MNGILIHLSTYLGKLSNETCIGNWTRYVSGIRDAMSAVSAGRYFTAFDMVAHFGAVKEVEGHYYEGNTGTAATLESTLMNLSTTHPHLNQFKVHIDWLRANKRDIPSDITYMEIFGAFVFLSCVVCTHEIDVVDIMVWLCSSGFLSALPHTLIDHVCMYR